MALAIGEIHTVLLRTSTALPNATAATLLETDPTRRSRTWERPVRQAASPPQLTGVDCWLPTTSGARTRAVGTVVCRTWLTSGNLLQVSGEARLVSAEREHRRAWSHYLTAPGTIEILGDADLADVEHGFLETETAPEGVLDLAAITDAALGRVQGSPMLDHRPPFRQRRTRLRWSAAPAPPGAESARLTLEEELLRTLLLRIPAAAAGTVTDLSLELARHDWLLTTLIARLDSAATGRAEKNLVVGALRPALDHLLHAWMPAGRLPDELVPFWSELDRRSGLSRQWASAVSRIRDQVALAAATAAPERTIQLPAVWAAEGATRSS